MPVILPYIVVFAVRVVASCPVQRSAMLSMLLVKLASTVSSVATIAKKSPVTDPVPFMYCPPLRPSPLYSFAMIFIFLWVKWFDK
jgi:hypothetical protein